MNNEQFRRILFDNPSPSSTSTSKPAKRAEPVRSTRPGVLLAPRSIASRNTPKSTYTFTKPSKNSNVDGEERASKRQKASTSVPKGSRFAQGYTDRAALLRSQKSEDDEEDEMSSKIARIKNLEEALKNEELTEREFEKLKSEIVNGDVRLLGAVSKGLDKGLLARVRRGEQVDVFDSSKATEGAAQDEEEEELDPDSALDAALNMTIAPGPKEEKAEKKGQLAKLSSASIAAEKLSRNEILARMKAERAASKPQVQTQEALGARFKRIDAPTSSNGTAKPRARSSNDPLKRYEIDEQGREVLLILDERGNVLKRKVRKTKDVSIPEPEPVTQTEHEESQREKEKKTKKRKNDETNILGGDVIVPVLPAAQVDVEDDDDDIFADAGTAYDPLGEDDAPSSDDEVKTKVDGTRNYFNDAPVTIDTGPSKEELLSKISALSRTAAASSLAAPSHDHEGDESAKRESDEQRLARLTRNDARDDEDMDFGGGYSRFDEGEGDAEEEGGKKKGKGKKGSGLSEWTGLPTQNEKGEGGKKKKSKKKGKE